VLGRFEATMEQFEIGSALVSRLCRISSRACP
jgi:hypothetical protein